MCRDHENGLTFFKAEGNPEMQDVTHNRTCTASAVKGFVTGSRRVGLIGF
jgi:hypothetical protein